MFEDLINSLDGFLKKIDEDKALSSVIGMFLVLYAGLAAPKLPRVIADLFDHSGFRLAVLFMIAYTASKNSGVAIVATVALLMSFQTLSMYKTNDVVVNTLDKKVKEEVVLDVETDTELIVASDSEAPMGYEDATTKALEDINNMPAEFKVEEVELVTETDEQPVASTVVESETEKHHHKVVGNSNDSLYSTSPETVNDKKWHVEPKIDEPKVNDTCDFNAGSVKKTDITGYSTTDYAMY